MDTLSLPIKLFHVNSFVLIDAGVVRQETESATTRRLQKSVVVGRDCREVSLLESGSSYSGVNL